MICVFAGGGCPGAPHLRPQDSPWAQPRWAALLERLQFCASLLRVSFLFAT